MLASGLIAQATACNADSDLFCALTDGANSFGIITEFVIKTVDSPQVWAGIAHYDESQSPSYLDAVYNFGEYGSLDSKAAIIPTVVMSPSEKVTTYAATKFYDSAVVNSIVFEDFTAPVLVPVLDTFILQPLATCIAGVDALQPSGFRQEFCAFSSIVRRDAIHIIHDVFYEGKHPARIYRRPTSTSHSYPVSEAFILREDVKNGGKPQGIGPFESSLFTDG